MRDPVFQSVEQALHFSFLMDVLPATTKSTMQVMIQRRAEEMGLAPKGERGSINFSGLTALEVRGQCAMVRGAVAHHLPAPEQAAVHARYGHQVAKAEGVRGMRDYCLPRLRVRGDGPTLAVCWKVYGSLLQRESLSLRRMEEEFGTPKTTISRDVAEVARAGRALEGMAVDRLRPLFEADGLVARADAC